MLVDSHCHLDYFTAAELPDVLARAAAAGVGEMVTIGTTLAQSATLPGLIAGHPNLWCTIGVHPHHAAEAPIPSPETLAEMAQDQRVIGIGESGLDYFYDKAPRDIQAENFRAHIRGARLAGGGLLPGRRQRPGGQRCLARCRTGAHPHRPDRGQGHGALRLALHLPCRQPC